MENSSGSDSFFKNASDEIKEKSFDLSSHLINLMFKEPFYTRIYRSMNKIETDTIPTAAVTVIDNNFTLFWNRKFLSSLDPKEVRGLLKHEALHLVFDHVVKRKLDPHIIWNYATDLAINSTIPYGELPKGGLVPGRYLPELTEEEMKVLDDKEIERYHKFRTYLKNLPVDKTSEFYFNELMKNEEIKEIIESKESKNFSFDEHSLWDDISNEDMDIIKAKLDELIKEASKDAECKGWGSVPSHVRKDLLKKINKKINWSSLLKRFCAHARSNERTGSIKRLNRKYPGIHPGVKKNYKPKIAVYIDESGSMDNAVLEMLYGELETLSKHIDFYVYKFDHYVDDESGFLWKKGSKISITRNLSGGTCFNAPTKHALKNKSKIDGYIIMTDGCAPKPVSSSGLRRAWILTPNDRLVFTKDNLDCLIQMN